LKLFQIFLPLQDNQGKNLPKELFAKVKEKLVEKFGGMTAFTQSPATGLWESTQDSIVKDRLVIFEVMVENFEFAWWRDYKKFLEIQFKQEQIVIRTFEITII
jgi:hypothetical protein